MAGAFEILLVSLLTGPLGPMGRERLANCGAGIPVEISEFLRSGCTGFASPLRSASADDSGSRAGP